MRRHSFDPISFVLGGLCAVIGVTFLFGRADIGDLHLSVVWPIPLIVIGLLMLASTQRRVRERPRAEEASPALPERDRELEPAPVAGDANHATGANGGWADDADRDTLADDDEAP